MGQATLANIGQIRSANTAGIDADDCVVFAGLGGATSSSRTSPGPWMFTTCMAEPFIVNGILQYDDRLRDALIRLISARTLAPLAMIRKHA